MRKSRKQIKQERIDNANINEDGLSLHEIAKILNLPLNIVKRIEINALRKLQSPTEKNKKLHKYWKIGLKPEDSTEG